MVSGSSLFPTQEHKVARALVDDREAFTRVEGQCRGIIGSDMQRDSVEVFSSRESVELCEHGSSEPPPPELFGDENLRQVERGFPDGRNARVEFFHSDPSVCSTGWGLSQRLERADLHRHGFANIVEAEESAQLAILQDDSVAAKIGARVEQKPLNPCQVLLVIGRKKGVEDGFDGKASACDVWGQMWQISELEGLHGAYATARGHTAARHERGSRC